MKFKQGEIKMKTTVSMDDFRTAFEIRKDNFSYDGLFALYDYLERLEQDIGVEFELDVIAFCYEYAEYENIKEFNAEYNTEYENYKDINETTVIPISDESFIIQRY